MSLESTTSIKRKEAEELRKHIEEFLAKGGKIQQIKPGVVAQDLELSSRQRKSIESV